MTQTIRDILSPVSGRLFGDSGIERDERDAMAKRVEEAILLSEQAAPAPPEAPRVEPMSEQDEIAKLQARCEALYADKVAERERAAQLECERDDARAQVVKVTGKPWERPSEARPCLFCKAPTTNRFCSDSCEGEYENTGPHSEDAIPGVNPPGRDRDLARRIIAQARAAHDVLDFGLGLEAKIMAVLTALRSEAAPTDASRAIASVKYAYELLKEFDNYGSGDLDVCVREVVRTVGELREGMRSLIMANGALAERVPADAIPTTNRVKASDIPMVKARPITFDDDGPDGCAREGCPNDARPRHHYCSWECVELEEKDDEDRPRPDEVGTHTLTPTEIAIARAEDRLRVTARGLGFVRPRRERASAIPDSPDSGAAPAAFCVKCDAPAHADFMASFDAAPELWAMPCPIGGNHRWKRADPNE